MYTVYTVYCIEKHRAYIHRSLFVPYKYARNLVSRRWYDLHITHRALLSNPKHIHTEFAYFRRVVFRSLFTTGLILDRVGKQITMLDKCHSMTSFPTYRHLDPRYLPVDTKNTTPATPGDRRMYIIIIISAFILFSPGMQAPLFYEPLLVRILISEGTPIHLLQEF